MPKHLTKILQKMFKMAKEPFPDANYFLDDNWFCNHSATEKQHKDFRKWMIKYLQKNREARIELYDMYRKNDKLIERGVDNFIFNFFWRYE